MAVDLDLGVHDPYGEPSPDPDPRRPVLPRRGVDETARMPLRAARPDNQAPVPGEAVRTTALRKIAVNKIAVNKTAVETTVAIRPDQADRTHIGRGPQPSPVGAEQGEQAARTRHADVAPVGSLRSDSPLEPGQMAYSPHDGGHQGLASDRPGSSDDVHFGGRRGMDIKDYLAMLRRGWLMIVAFSVGCVTLAGIYLTVTPPSYEAATSLFVTANDPQTIGDLSQGDAFSSRAVATYAGIIDSETVLGPVSTALRPQVGVDSLVAMVTATARTSTSLIDIVVAGRDPAQATTIANAVAASASRIIPTLQGDADGRPLVRIQQTRPAVEPAAPVSPGLKRTLALGLVIGLCLGVGATITRQSLDTRVRRAEDLRRITDLPLLAVVPSLRSGRGLAVRDEPTGDASEAFRALRTNVRFLEATERRSMVIAAVAEDGDGPQVTANLAWSLAEAGRRVLLVDADLRHSKVGDLLGIDAGLGLSDVLAGRADLGAAARTSHHPGLRVVLSGSPRPSPSDLLSSPVLAGILRHWERENDYVILHTPPLLAHTDAAVVAGVVGGTFLSVAAGATRIHEVSAALDALANVRIMPLGLVFTGAQSRGGSRGGGGVPRSRVSRPAVRALRSHPAPRPAQS
jgi:capsular exopolysaccharide synthesis family protein